MGTAGRPGEVDAAEQQRVLDDFRYREPDGTSRTRAARRHLSSPATAVQGPEPFIGRVFALPPVTADDFGRVDRPERLLNAGNWQEWLAEYTGREAWAEDPGGFEKVPETNFMARAEPGDTTNGYVKTGETLHGLDVWRKRGGTQDG